MGDDTDRGDRSLRGGSRDAGERLKPAADAERGQGCQFSVFSQLLLTTLTAGILAVLRPLRLPPSMRMALGAYAMLLAVYLAFRGLDLWQRARRRSRRLKERRRQLKQWVGQQRGLPSQSSPSEGSPDEPPCGENPEPTTDEPPRV